MGSADPKLLTISEAAARMNVGKTFFRTVVLPEIATVRRGRFVRIPEASLKKWVDANSSRY